MAESKEKKAKDENVKQPSQHDLLRASLAIDARLRDEKTTAQAKAIVNAIGQVQAEAAPTEEPEPPKKPSPPPPPKKDSGDKAE